MTLLRGLNPNLSDNFYTTNVVEMENAILNGGYNSEGDAAQVLPSQVSNTVPLYRMYSPGARDHFYTTKVTERNNAISSLGYTDEGITAYVYPSNLCGSVPLCRMYNPREGKRPLLHD